VTATSTTWTVTPFGGIIDAEAAAAAGPYAYAFQSNQTGSITAAAGSDRYDRLDVQISDPAESDGTSNPLVTIIYTAGTPGAGVIGAAPARSHLLTTILVPASGGGSPTVIFNPQYSAAAGGAMPFNNTTELNAVTNAGVGQLATTQTDSVNLYPTLWMWSGSAWAQLGQANATIAVTPATGWASAASPNVARLVMQGKQVTVYGSLTWTGGGSYNNMFTVPAAFRPPSSGVRNIGRFEQITGSALNFGHAILTQSTGVLGVGTGTTISLPASGAVFLDGISWWMD
jgi:hypothetical protein